jgi:hypothetical protein
MTVPRQSKHSRGSQLILAMFSKSTPEEERRKRKIVAEKKAEECAEMAEAQAKHKVHVEIEQKRTKKERAAERQRKKRAKDKEHKKAAKLALVRMTQPILFCDVSLTKTLEIARHIEARKPRLDNTRPSCA